MFFWGGRKGNQGPRHGYHAGIKSIMDYLHEADMTDSLHAELSIGNLI